MKVTEESKKQSKKQKPNWRAVLDANRDWKENIDPNKKGASYFTNKKDSASFSPLEYLKSRNEDKKTTKTTVVPEWGRWLEEFKSSPSKRVQNMAKSAPPMTSSVVRQYLQGVLHDERVVDLIETNNEQLQYTGHVQTQALKTSLKETSRKPTARLQTDMPRGESSTPRPSSASGKENEAPIPSSPSLLRSPSIPPIDIHEETSTPFLPRSTSPYEVIEEDYPLASSSESKILEQEALPIYCSWIDHFVKKVRKVQPNPFPKLPMIFRSKNEEHILNFVHAKLSQETISTLETKDIMVALSNIINCDMDNAENIFGSIVGRIKNLCALPICQVQGELLSELNMVLQKDGMEGLLLEAQIRKGDLAHRKRAEGIPSKEVKDYDEQLAVLSLIEYFASMIIKKKFESHMTEMTSTAHWNYVFSLLLEYPIFMELGELACKASQKDISSQELLFGPVHTHQSPGRKIDMLLRVVENSAGERTLIEIGCNEHKAAHVDLETVHIQTLKSHRVNSSILTQLENQGLDAESIFPLYLDAHGMDACLFAMRRVEDIHGVARLGGVLVLPTNEEEMEIFLGGETISLLFIYKERAMAFAKEVLRSRAQCLLSKRNRTPSPPRIRTPSVFTPRKSRETQDC